MRCSDTNKNNKLHNPSVLHETIFLSLINPSLAYVYCSHTLSNHELDSSRKLVVNYAISFIINLYLILHTGIKHSIG